MAEQPKQPQPQPPKPQPPKPLDRETARPARTEARTLADRDVARDFPEPEHGDPAENLSPHESVIGVRVGSEASVESGTDPVLPAVGGNISALTEVKNKDLRERDEREREKRGPDGGVFEVSVTFPGLMVVEVDGGSEKIGTKQDGDKGTSILRSGSFTGHFMDEIRIRPLTEEELAEYVPSAAPADKQAVERRAADLIKGAGQGGGGNPMKAHEARGTTSGVTQPAGGAASTSGPQLGGGVRTSRG